MIERLVYATILLVALWGAYQWHTRDRDCDIGWTVGEVCR